MDQRRLHREHANSTMQWIATPERDNGQETLETRLWAAADQLRANSGLTSAQYSQPVLGLIFLRFAEVRFNKRRAALGHQATGSWRGSRIDDPTAYQADALRYLTPKACFDYLLRLPGARKPGRPSTRPCATSRRRINGSPESCRRPIRSSTTRYSRACSSE